MKARVRAELARRAAERWPDDPEKNGLDYVADWQANGKLLKDLADELECSPAFLREDLRIRYGASVVKAALEAARREGAHAHAEEALAEADKATAADAAAARLRVDTRKWLTGMWNREEFGQAKGPTVQVSFGSLFLQALSAPVEAVTAVAPARGVAELADPQSPGPSNAIAPAIPEEATVLSIEETPASERDQ